MTTARKRKAKKTVKREPTYSKVYLCGNNYAKLSGLFVTSLNNMNAISEWNNIPFIQQLYGAKLIGYCPNPEGTEDSVGFLRTERNPSGISPHIGSIYYPVYERKVYTLDSSNDSYLTPISALASDLKWISGEKIKLNINLKNQVFNANDEMKLAESESEILLLSTDSNISCSGSFVVDLIMAGAALSDKIDLSKSSLLNEKTSVSSIEILPNGSPGDPLENRDLLGSKYILSSQTALNDFYELACWKTSEDATLIDTRLGTPLKLPFVLSRDSSGVVEYYKSLGYDIPDDFLASYENAEALSDALTAQYPDVPLPSFGCEQYETTLTPSHNGWYSFLIETDDVAFAFMDDKLVAADIYTPYDKLTGDSGGNIANLNVLVNGIASVNQCPYDINQMSAFVSADSPLGDWASLDTIKLDILTAETLESVSAEFLDGTLTGNFAQFAEKISGSVGNPLSNDFFVSDLRIEDASDGGLLLESKYYSYGCYIYLLSGQNYKFRMIHGDGTGNRTGEMLPSDLNGRSANRILYDYISAISEVESPAELDVRRRTRANAASTTFKFEHFLCANYKAPDEGEQYNVLSGCKTENKLAKAASEIAENVMWNDVPLSDAVGDSWPNIAPQKYIGTAAFFNNPSTLSHSIPTLLTVRDLTDEEIRKASENCCYASMLYKTKDHNQSVVLAQTPLCLSGYAGFNRKQTT